MAELIQPSLTGGELSPSLYARVDLARYATSLRTVRNWIVRPYGGVETRPGTMFVDEVRDSEKPVLLLDFQFSTEQAYVLVFNDGFMRVIKDAGVVQDGGGPYELALPYADADYDLLKWTQSADVMTLVHPDYPPYELRRNSEIDWEFVEFGYENGPFLDANVDESITVYASAATGTVTLTASDDIFNANHVGALFKLEQRDLSGIVPWESDKRLAGPGVNVLGLMRRSDGKVYECVTDFAAGSSKDTHTGTVRPTHSKGIASDGDGNPLTGTDTQRAGVDWLYVHSGYGICRITAYTSPTEVTAEVLVQLPSSVVGGAVSAAGPWTGSGDGVTTAFSITGATSDNPADYRVLLDDTVVSSSNYSVNATTDLLTFDVAPGSGVDIDIEQLEQDNSTDVWYFGAWSEDQGYPRAVAYYGDRLWFGGTIGRPATVWASKVSNYTDFGVETPSVDDDAITATINSRLVNQIRDIVAINSLVILTSGAEWLVTGGQDEVITPSSIGFKPQSYRGSADLQAKVVGTNAIYVQERGQNIRDLSYSLEIDGFNGADLTLLSDHLFRGYSIVSMAFAQIPWSVVWCVRSDGTLLGLTYQREQEVVGWHRHDTSGEYLRVSCIPETTEDALYVAVRREIDGAEVVYIERMSTRIWEDDSDIFCVDSGLTFNGANTNGSHTVTLSGGTNWDTTETLTLTAAGGLTFAAGDVGDELRLDARGTDELALPLLVVGYTDSTHVSVQAQRDVIATYRNTALSAWSWARNSISGLDHLEGETVAAFGDGSDLGDFTVTSGAITLPEPCAIVHAGLSYTCDLEPLDLNLSGAETIRTRPKRVVSIGVLVQDSRGLKAGRDASNLYDVKQRNNEALTSPVARRTGLFEMPCTGTWEQGASFLIRQSRPVPATVLALIPEVEIGGR